MASISASSIIRDWAPLLLLLDFSYSVRIFLKISFIYFFVITKSWFLYYFTTVTNNNYTNKCQLVTVLLVLLLSCAQAESSIISPELQTTQIEHLGKCSPCDHPMDFCSISSLYTGS